MKFSQDEELKSEIVDLGGIFLIKKNLISKEYEIKESSIFLKFIEIRESRMFILNYVILSIYLFNISIMSNDK